MAQSFHLPGNFKPLVGPGDNDRAIVRIGEKDFTVPYAVAKYIHELQKAVKKAELWDQATGAIRALVMALR